MPVTIRRRENYIDSNGEYGTIGDGNPIAWLDLGGTVNKKRHNMQASGSLKYDIWDGLALKGVGAYKLYLEDHNEFLKDIQYNASKYHGPLRMYQTNTTESTVYGDVLLTYEKGFGLHNLNALAGFHAELFQQKYTEAYRQDFPNNDVGDLNAGSTSGMSNAGFTRELAMMSWLGRFPLPNGSAHQFRRQLSVRRNHQHRWRNIDGRQSLFAVGNDHHMGYWIGCNFPEQNKPDVRLLRQKNV